MPERGQRKKTKQAKCTPAEHKERAAHRKAQARYVAKNRAKQRARARSYYARNKARVKAQRKAAKGAAHKAIVAARRKRYGGSRGRPREC